jgi:hemerythrin-like domain-containing protein
MGNTDAFTLMKDDHDRFRRWFREYEGLEHDAYEAKAGLAETIFNLLNAHETMEEEIFYPAIRAHATEEGVESVLEGYEEHHVAEMKSLDVKDERHGAKFKVFVENVEHHIDEEEEELFPEARKALGDRAGEIGEAMARRREELLKEAAGAR